MMNRFTLCLCLLFCPVGTIIAHFPILTVDNPDAKKGVPVVATLRYGHPFENEWDDCPQPQKAYLLLPEKGIQNVPLEKMTFQAGDKSYQAWKIQFTPEMRGDYLLRIEGKPTREKPDQPLVQETVETWVHVQREQGWSRTNDPITCLTRPYGLLPGMVFQGQIFGSKGKVANAPIEWEMLNPTPPKQLPKGPLITFSGKTDDQGKFVVSLPKPGWWGVAAEVSETKGSETTILRHILWLQVDKAD